MTLLKSRFFYGFFWSIFGRQEMLEGDDPLEDYQAAKLGSPRGWFLPGDDPWVDPWVPPSELPSGNLT